MNPIRRAYRTVATSAKAFVMRWASRQTWTWGTGLGRTRFDYKGAVGDGRGNAIVVACVLWLCRTFPEAPLRVQRRGPTGALEDRDGHPLARLLAVPNPFYSGILLWQATLADWMVGGNAYWLKVRSAGGRVVELWWVPSGLMRPVFPEDGSRFLDGYEYTPNGTPIRIDAADVVHFRYGLDPQNARLGLSPLASLVRELFTDDEGANFTASLLKNLGVPGVVIAPDDADTTVTQEDADRIKSEFSARFGGDNRGAAMVMSAKVKTTVLSFSPEQMNLKGMRRLPEERVTAVFGLSAMVVGLGVGLEHSTFANYAEAREAAYESNVIPTQRLLAQELQTQLLPDVGDAAAEVINFDNSQVRVLQPDQDRLYARLDVAVRGGWVTPNEAREKVGLDQLPAGGDVLYVPVSAVPTPPEEIGVAPAPASLPPPAPLHALPPPPPKHRGVGVETKGSASNLADALTRVRARHQVPLERELASLLASQRARVVAAVSSQEKAISLSDVFDAIAETRHLTRTLEKWYRRVLSSVHGLTEDGLGVSFELDDPATRAYLAEAGRLIRDITEHTRGDIARALQEGQAAGEGIPQLAARIESLTAFNRARATTIARTELGAAANEAAITSYRASGVVVGVQVFDGEEHAACAEWNGRKLTLEQARSVPRLAHPNCVRAFGAIVDAAELEAVA